MIQSRTVAQRLVDELSEVDGVRVALIVGRDGAPSADVVIGEDEALMGALSGAIFAAINRSMQRTGLGELEDLVLSAGEGSIQAVAANDHVIVVMADRQTNVGMIRLALRRAAGQLSLGE